MRKIILILAIVAVAASCGSGGEDIDKLEVYESFRASAMESYEQGDIPLALQYISRALAYAPARREPYELANRFHIEMGSDSNAVRYFEMTAQLDVAKDQPWPWYFTGYNLFRMRQYDAALENFLEASRKNPDEPDIHFRIGLVYEALGESENAVEAMRQAWALNPESVGTVVALSRLLRRSGDMAGAEQVVTVAMNIAPADPGLMHSIGLIRRDQHLAEHAERAFRRVLELHPEHVDSRRELLAILKKSGRAEEAARQRRVLDRLDGYRRGRIDLMRTAASSTGDPGPALAIAELELTEKKFELALRWFTNTAAAGGPADRIASGRAEALFGLDLVDEGDLALGSVSDPTASRVALAQAMRFVALEDLNSVREALEKALQDPPMDRLFLLRVSDLYLILGDMETAERLMDRAAGL